MFIFLKHAKEHEQLVFFFLSWMLDHFFFLRQVALFSLWVRVTHIRQWFQLPTDLGFCWSESLLHLYLLMQEHFSHFETVSYFCHSGVSEGVLLFVYPSNLPKLPFFFSIYKLTTQYNVFIHLFSWDPNSNRIESNFSLLLPSLSTR